MYTLGIHQGHDASCAIAKDGTIVAAVAEERFTQIKHYGGVPHRSLDYCLSEAGVGINDIDILAFPSIGGYDLLDVLFNLRGNVPYVKSFAESGDRPSDYIRKLGVQILKNLKFWMPLELPLYMKSYPFKNPVMRMEHHLAHAASAYYTSGFQEKTLVITSDGSGDGLSNTVWIGENGVLTPKLKLGRNSSLGAFYGVVTEALGWWVGDGEGKTMGLAPYGSTKKTKGVLDRFAPHFKNGDLIQGFNWGHAGIWEDESTYHFHIHAAQEVKKLISKYSREDIAAEAQRILENELLNFILPWIKREKVTKLAASGGVFLNVKANQHIWESGLLSDFFVYPESGDGGIAVGAALYAYFSQDHNAFSRKKQIRDVYWGPSYSITDTEKLLKTRKIHYKKYSKSDMAKKVASYLSKNKIVAVFQGRMEAGPRALGNRSILMSPLLAKNKDIINKTVKYREGFRPFCPTILQKRAHEYLVKASPNAKFMIISFDVYKEKQKEIPAVVHVDNTARPQILERRDNPFYYDVIEEFEKITGTPVILDTSLNLKGEAVVCSPSDAIKCFFDSGIDYLVFEGRIIIAKSPRG